MNMAQIAGFNMVDPCSYVCCSFCLHNQLTTLPAGDEGFRGRKFTKKPTIKAGYDLEYMGLKTALCLHFRHKQLHGFFSKRSANLLKNILRDMRGENEVDKLRQGHAVQAR